VGRLAVYRDGIGWNPLKNPNSDDFDAAGTFGVVRIPSRLRTM
jgi:hypothetical protein